MLERRDRGKERDMKEERQERTVLGVGTKEQNPCYFAMLKERYMRFHFIFSAIARNKVRVSISAILYQVGNTSSRKNTEVTQLGPRLALGSVTI